MDTIEIHLLQDAYVSGTINAPYFQPDAPYFEASAVDDEGREYIVIWEIQYDLDDFYEMEDHGDACDWENPKAIIRLDDHEDVTGRCVFV